MDAEQRLEGIARIMSLPANREAFSGRDVATVRLGADALALLRELRGWDHFDGAADGPYWKGRIDALLTRAGRA